MRLVRSRGSRLGVDNSAVDYIDCGTGTSIANITAGSILVWTRPSSVANLIRNIASKTVTGGGWEIFKGGTDGTLVRLSASRTTSGFSMDSVTGTLVVSVWQMLAFTWDLSDSTKCKLYRSTGGPLTDATGTVTIGSGAQNTDAAKQLRMLCSSAPHAGWPGEVGAFALICRVLSASEIAHAVNAPWSTLGCAGLWYPGHDGATGLVIDRSGNGNHGTCTGTTMSAAPPIGVSGAFSSSHRLGA